MTAAHVDYVSFLPVGACPVASLVMKLVRPITVAVWTVFCLFSAFFPVLSACHCFRRGGCGRGEPTENINDGPGVRPHSAPWATAAGGGASKRWPRVDRSAAATTQPVGEALRPLFALQCFTVGDTEISLRRGLARPSAPNAESHPSTSQISHDVAIFADRGVNAI